MHVREADRYAALHPERPELADAEVLPWLRLGAIFPDIRSAVSALPLNSHDRSLGYALAALADADGTPRQRAFALGYRLHTASDTAAQVFYLPWLTASSDLQVVNLFGAADIGDHGDNELLVEGFGDLHSGDLASVLDVVWYFVLEHPDALDEVVELFVAALHATLLEGYDEAAVRAGLASFRAQVEEQLGSFDKDVLVGVLTEAKGWDLETVLAVLTTGFFGELLAGVPEAPGSLEVDPYEIARLSAHPVGQDPAGYFASYDAHFADLGAAILDDPGFDSWPWWRGEPIVASVLQGLALDGARTAHRPEVLVYGAGFRGSDGASLASLDPAALPGTVRAWAEVFPALGEAVEVALEVVARPPGLSGDPTPVASSAAIALPGPGRLLLTVDFDPAPLASIALAYDLRLRVTGDERPFLESWWARYAVYAQAPLFRPPFADGYAGFPPALPVAHTTARVDWGWVRGHVILPDARRGTAATVALDAAVSVEAQAGGGFGVEPLTPGPHLAQAFADGFTSEPQELEVAAGQETVVVLPLIAVPSIQAPPWSADRSTLAFRWLADPAATPPTRYAIAAGDALDPEAHAAWSEVGAAASGTVAFAAAPLADGTRLRPWVKGAGFPPSRGPEVAIDGSAPPLPEVLLAADADRCPPILAVDLLGGDPHSPIVSRRARLEGGPWVSVAAGTALEVGVPAAPRPVTLEAQVQNAAGLWSEAVAVEVCAPSRGPSAESGADLDAGPALEEASPVASGRTAGCAAPATRRSPAGAWLYLLAGALAAAAVRAARSRSRPASSKCECCSGTSRPPPRERSSR